MPSRHSHKHKKNHPKQVKLKSISDTDWTIMVAFTVLLGIGVGIAIGVSLFSSKAPPQQAEIEAETPAISVETTSGGEPEDTVVQSKEPGPPAWDARARRAPEASLSRLKALHEQALNREIEVDKALAETRRQLRTLREKKRRGKALEILDALVVLRHDRVVEAAQNLRDKVLELSKREGPQAALTYLDEYEGPYAEDIAETRQRFRAQLEEHIELQGRKHSELLQEIAENILAGDFSAAASLAENAEDTDLEATIAMAEEAAKCRDIILGSFRRQTGDVIELEIAGRTRTIKVFGIANDRIAVGRKVSDGWQRFFLPINHVGTEDIIQRLDGVPPVARSLFAGALAAKGARFDEARECFANVPALSEALNAALDKKLGRSVSGEKTAAGSEE